MIIVEREIRHRCVHHELLHPWVERTVHACGMSYGLSMAGYDVRIQENQGCVMEPGDFRLFSTLERFTMPNDLLAMVADKSTLARMGIAVQNTVIEPGWRGHLTLEITNHGPRAVTFYGGQPIAQILFLRTSEPAKSYAGKYQDQPDRPVGPVKERNE